MAGETVAFRLIRARARLVIAQLLRLFEKVLVAGLLVHLDALAHADLRVARLLQATTRRVLLAGE